VRLPRLLRAQTQPERDGWHEARGQASEQSAPCRWSGRDRPAAGPRV